MSRALRLIFPFLLLVTICFPSLSAGQELNNPEAEYERIRLLALDGKSDSALLACRNLIVNFPLYGDAHILLGRIMAWKKDYVVAGHIADSMLKADPANGDAAELRRDINRYKDDGQERSVGIRSGYFFDSFTKPYQRLWQVFGTALEKKFTWGLLSGGVNLGHARAIESGSGGNTEWQVETEAYPEISAGKHAYIAYSFSPGSWFPTHRAALEIWQSLPEGWSISAGLNYYYFSRNNYIALASAEKYTGPWWISLKGYLCFREHGGSVSAYLFMRRYFSGRNYLQLTFGAGSGPDEPYDIRTDLMRYSAYTARLTYNLSLGRPLELKIMTGYVYEEFQNQVFRNRFDGSVNLFYSIKTRQ